MGSKAGFVRLFTFRLDKPLGWWLGMKFEDKLWKITDFFNHELLPCLRVGRYSLVYFCT